ncbi:GLPGLI family protein [Sediminibacterium ginsengisoli]|uniref:GLPGLI family protein n=1 Tax=Sediminibacterium ginsengisoli TaxID=413434 RepID=A0A1T4JUW7_9BACT|nr:GLPGLI family protein [Sediminibacterium ginsengisoli]SJZ34022.1 GLPGLI family protein [Sediminibacterium ginsengisoli]
MKRYITVVFVSFLCLNLKAQETTILNVVYDFSYTRDLADPSNPYKSEMILSAGQSGSRYTTRDLFNRNSPAAIKLNKQREAKESSGAAANTTVAVGGPMLTVSNAGTLINEEIFISKTNGTVQTAGRIGFKNYHFSVPLPSINWKLGNEQKMICGYNCQKAVGDFGGRTFEAWFVPDLPYSFGPWKLNGLPGLILSANDTKNEISFTCKEITKNSDPEELITSYMNLGRSVEVKPKEYQRVAGMFASDPAAMVEAQISGTTVSVRNLDSPGDKSIKKITRYNPMELK